MVASAATVTLYDEYIRVIWYKSCWQRLFHSDCVRTPQGLFLGKMPIKIIDAMMFRFPKL